MAFALMCFEQPELISNLLTEIENGQFESAMKLLEPLTSFCLEGIVPDWTRVMQDREAKLMLPKPRASITTMPEFWKHYEILLTNYEVEMMRTLVFRLRAIHNRMLSKMQVAIRFKYYLCAKTHVIGPGMFLHRMFVCRLLSLQQRLTRMVMAARQHGKFFKTHLLAPVQQSYAIDFHPTSPNDAFKFCFRCDLYLPPFVHICLPDALVRFTPWMCTRCSFRDKRDGIHHIFVGSRVTN